MGLTTDRDRTSADDLDDLRHAILRRVSAVVRAAGLEEHEIGCRLVGGVSELSVELTGPALATSVQHALRVRVLDAIHADGRTFGRVAMAFRFGAEVA